MRACVRVRVRTSVCVRIILDHSGAQYSTGAYTNAGVEASSAVSLW